MAKFRRGREAAEAAKNTGGGRRFTPTFKWKEDGDEYFLKFLHPSEDIMTILYHPYIIVGEREDGRSEYKDFISPLDPAFADEMRSDPLVDRFDVAPKTYRAALAVELEPVKEGRKIVDWQVVERTFTNKDDEEVSVPNVALVLLSAYYDLWNHLETHEDVKGGTIDNYVFQVIQKGKGKDKSLLPYEISEAPDIELDESDIFDWEAHFEQLGSAARFAKYIDPLPDDAVVVQEFGGGKNTKTKAKAKSSSRKPSSRVSSKADTPVETRSTRFSSLKSKVAQAAEED